MGLQGLNDKLAILSQGFRSMGKNVDAISAEAVKTLLLTGGGFGVLSGGSYLLLSNNNHRGKILGDLFVVLAGGVGGYIGLEFGFFLDNFMPNLGRIQNKASTIIISLSSLAGGAFLARKVSKLIKT